MAGFLKPLSPSGDRAQGKAIASLSVLEKSKTRARNPDSPACRLGLWSSIRERAVAHDFRSNHPPGDSDLIDRIGL